QRAELLFAERAEQVVLVAKVDVEGGLCDLRGACDRARGEPARAVLAQQGRRRLEEAAAGFRLGLLAALASRLRPESDDNTIIGEMEDFPIVVVGTGFSGIAMGVELKRAGIESFTILEKAGDIGGTWRENAYPGAACDVPSHLYCFSFEPKPDWSRAFSPQ